MTYTEIQHQTLGNGIELIKLIGKLDIISTGEIETKFAGYCAGEKPRVAAGLPKMGFLASIGVRLPALNPPKRRFWLPNAHLETTCRLQDKNILGFQSNNFYSQFPSIG